MGQRDGQIGIVSVCPDAPAASLASAYPVRRLHPIAAFVKRKGRKHIFMQFFHIFVRASVVLFLFVAASCQRGPGNDRQSQVPPPYPELRELESVVREVRALLPALPSGKEHPPAMPRVPVADRLPRLLLAGEGRLIRTGEGPPLPAALQVELYLDGNDPPAGYLMIQAGSNPPDCWPILDVQRAGAGNENFSYMFRVLDKQSRLRYLSLLGLYHGTGELRFRSFEGYLIIPGEAGSVNTRPPVYAIDFGYHWPVPPRFLARLDSLKQESEALDTQLVRLREVRSRSQDLYRQRETLAAAAVPPEQEAKRQQDLAVLGEQIAQAGRERETLSGDMAARVERIYGTRREMAQDWAAFHESNPYRWMTPAERLAAFDQIQPAGTLRAGWREAYAAIEGDSKPALRSARQAMEQSLPHELELRP
jgi:hypothetical protein